MSRSPAITMMASVQFCPQLTPSPSLIFSAKEVSRGCEGAIELLELVAELLLLRSGSKARALYPVSRSGDSYNKSRDAIIANTKGLAISIKDLTRQLKEETFTEVERTVQMIADKVTVLIEAATHAAYVTALCDVNTVPAQPGVVDQYYFNKAKLIISNTCSKLSPARGPLTSENILELTKTIASHLTILRQGCQQASENMDLGEVTRGQFSACVQCLDGVSAAFVASVKAFITNGHFGDRKKVAMFTDPLIAAVNSVVLYACLPEFAGQSAHLTPEGEQSQTDILASAMSVVSASIQMLNTTIALIEHKIGSNSAKNGSVSEKKLGSDERHWQRLVSCTRAVADSCKMLASSIREHTPNPSPLPTPSIPRAIPQSS